MKRVHTCCTARLIIRLDGDNNNDTHPSANRCPVRQGLRTIVISILAVVLTAVARKQADRRGSHLGLNLPGGYMMSKYSSRNVVVVRTTCM